MAQTINTNMASLNAQRNQAASQSSLATSMQRLSSGLRVNSAKDDAAGLAIAERMNAQVKGMNVAVRNANDGISMMQTTEGALGQLSGSMQRIRELAVQSANGSLSQSDRDNLQLEADQLQQEIVRVVQDSKFNGVTLFDSTATGSLAANAALSFQVGADNGDTIDVDGTGFDMTTLASYAAGATAVKSLDISSQAAASAALTSLDADLDAVNTARSTAGAVQSRFDAVISQLQVSAENTSAARGRIMDADFAAETANLSRAQILQQAGTAMIAQANQLPQSVMKLLG
ncbi:flagellin N-terminal helical domain-containing protein [Leptothrix discophora]|uniref:Flagellin n=1 Tax=Leptothrix discophora TaxID=89 RepID=A0ABT9G6D0_LEPDI|nr:flagellin [Leptothrix discophora]MDP4302041.1 flagellin [Leptothrix discophora]